MIVATVTKPAFVTLAFHSFRRLHFIRLSISFAEQQIVNVRANLLLNPNSFIGECECFSCFNPGSISSVGGAC